MGAYPTWTTNSPLYLAWCQMMGAVPTNSANLVGGPGYILTADIGGTAGPGRYNTIPALVAALVKLDGPKEVYVPEDATAVGDSCEWGDGTFDLGPDQVTFSAPDLNQDLRYDFSSVTGDAQIITRVAPIFSCNWDNNQTARPLFARAPVGSEIVTFLRGHYESRAQPFLEIDCAGGPTSIILDLRGNTHFSSSAFNRVISFLNVGATQIRFRLFDTAVLDCALISVPVASYTVEVCSAEARVLNPGNAIGGATTFLGNPATIDMIGSGGTPIGFGFPVPPIGNVIQDTTTGHRWINRGDGSWTGESSAVTYAPDLGASETVFTDFALMMQYLRGKVSPTVSMRARAAPYVVAGPATMPQSIEFVSDYDPAIGDFATLQLGDGALAGNDAVWIGPTVTHPGTVVATNIHITCHNVATPALTVTDSMQITCRGRATLVGAGTAPFLRRTTGFVNIDMKDASFLNGGVAHPLLTSSAGGTTAINFFDASRIFVNTFDPTDTTIVCNVDSSAAGINAAFLPRVSLKVGVWFSAAGNPNTANGGGPIPGAVGDVVASSTGGAGATLWVVEAVANTWIAK